VIPSQHHCEPPFCHCEPKAWQSYLVYFVTLSRSSERSEEASEGSRFFATLRMTRSEGLRMTRGEGFRVRMTGEGC